LAWTLEVVDLWSAANSYVYNVIRCFIVFIDIILF
jgi:hypothetical protein